MVSENIRVYIGFWNKEELVYALHKDEAIQNIKSHFKFGNPLQNEYAVGENWRSLPNEEGWHVIEKEVKAIKIEVSISVGDGNCTPHIIWECPLCNRHYSDEWRADDVLPVLLRCSCSEDQFFLGAEKG